MSCSPTWPRRTKASLLPYMSWKGHRDALSAAPQSEERAHVAAAHRERLLAAQDGLRDRIWSGVLKVWLAERGEIDVQYIYVSNSDFHCIPTWRALLSLHSLPASYCLALSTAQIMNLFDLSC